MSISTRLLLGITLFVGALLSPRAAQSVGAVPTFANTANASYGNSIPTAIPTGPAVVTSTISVAGAGTYLLDVNLVTFITHTAAFNLDITIQSPAGTVVTLTTDNGAGNDNVFNGTLWNDNANPAGQVPYATNNGLVTDHQYVNLTLASPLEPEESLAAFLGEDPNGIWTLTIVDDLAFEGGSLDSWVVDLVTLDQAPTTATGTFSSVGPVAIPTGPAVVSSTIAVAGAGTSLLDVNVMTFIPHTFPGDLDITIQSPAGTVVTLSTDNGAGNDDVFNGTLWDDDANPAGQVPYLANNGLVTDHTFVNQALASPLVPEEALGAFLGEDPNGTWILTVSDDLAADGGSIDSWSLELTTAKQVQAITFTNPGSQFFGTAPTLTATASSGLAVVFTSTTPGVCMITPGGTLSFAARGDCAVNADQPGDLAYDPAPTVAQIFAVIALPINDFDRDGRSDIGSYYPPGGNWYQFRSTEGFWQTQFGYAGTIPVTGDFDGDGVSDIGVYHPDSGSWNIFKSTEGAAQTQFGYAGTIPVVGDFDGDGRDDIGCYYPPGGNWYVFQSSSGFGETTFGYEGTIPVVGDFDGDGTSDIGCYYPPGGNWYVFQSTMGFWETRFGYAGTEPVLGDFDGDGRLDLGCYYPAGGNWYLFKSTEGFWETQFGYEGTIPLGGTIR